LIRATTSQGGALTGQKRTVSTGSEIGNEGSFTQVRQQRVLSRAIEPASSPTSVSMDSRDSRPLVTALAERIGDSTDAVQTTLIVVAMWREINASLSPILGERGVAAIYKRSLYLAADYPWLMRMHQDIDGSIDLDALGSVLSEQSSTDASAAGRALLESFYSLLTTLIGTSLTERLFRAVWANTTTETDAPPQDLSS